MLLSHGADVDAAMMNGRTTLHLAAMRSATGVAEVLLEHGCKVDPVSMENDEHKTPLMKAVDGGHIHMVEMLIQAGADVNFRYAAVMYIWCMVSTTPSRTLLNDLKYGM